MPQKPEKTFRIGLISASVFVNTPDAKAGRKPREYRSVSLQRRYKEEAEWKSSTSFGLSDLPNAIAVLQMAMQHIAQHEADVTA